MTNDLAVYAEKGMDLHCYHPVSFINMLILFLAKLIYIKWGKEDIFYLKIPPERDKCYLLYIDLWRNEHDIYSASVSIIEIALYWNHFLFIPLILDIKSIRRGVTDC